MSFTGHRGLKSFTIHCGTDRLGGSLRLEAAALLFMHDIQAEALFRQCKCIQDYLIADRYGLLRRSVAKACTQSTERHPSVIAMAHCDQRIAGARDMETSYSRSRRSVKSGEKAGDGDWLGENDGHMYSGIGLHMSRDAR